MKSIREAQINGGTLAIIQSVFPEADEHEEYSLVFKPIGKTDDEAVRIHMAYLYEHVEGVMEFLIENMSFQSMLMMGIGR